MPGRNFVTLLSRIPSNNSLGSQGSVGKLASLTSIDRPYAAAHHHHQHQHHYHAHTSPLGLPVTGLPVGLPGGYHSNSSLGSSTKCHSPLPAFSVHFRLPNGRMLSADYSTRHLIKK